MIGDDGVSITFELRLKPETVEGFRQGLPLMLKDTAAFPGFRHIRVVQHKDDPCRVVLIERWESEDAYRKYLAWRTETGAMDTLAQIAVRSDMNVWPNVVAEMASAEPIPEAEGASITFEIALKPEAVDAFVAMLPDTASFPGCRSLRGVRHKDDPARLLLIERWDSEEDYAKYLAWRTERGDVDRVAAMATGWTIEVWPTLVAHA
jgi:quinol monooxygenase YgiN